MVRSRPITPIFAIAAVGLAVAALAYTILRPTPVDGAATARQQVLAYDKGRGPVVAYNKWKWLKKTYWIVPQNGIYSVAQSGTDRFDVIRGQTVFRITDYFNGYWTGAVTVKLTRALVPACQYVLGEVTPQGRVYMTMYKADTGEVINNPVGTMVKKQGEWTMVNEMTSPAQGGTLSHWAYMLQSKPGDRTFKDLPFAHQSIPKFMSSCPKGPPIRR